MVAVIVSYTCPTCAEVFVRAVNSHDNKIFDIPRALCAACGTAPEMAYKVEKVTTSDAIQTAKLPVLADVDNRVLTELNKA